jgi:diguanylate cyclase (GGDEF)-like protein
MGIDIVAKFLINLIFVNIFPLFIYTSVRNQKLSVLVKNRDLFYLIYFFVSLLVLYMLMERKIFILIPIAIYILWIVIYETHIFEIENITKQNLQIIEQLSKEAEVSEQEYSGLKTEYENSHRELTKYEKLFSLVEEINKNIELSKVGEKFYSVITEYFGVDKINYVGILVVKKKDVIDIISFSSSNESLITTIKSLWEEKQTLSNIECFFTEKIYSNLYEYIFIIKHQLADRLLSQLRFFTNETKIGFVRSVLFKEVEELSRIDGLTGLYLRRYFISRLNNELLLASRYNTVISLIMIDIDFFKKINDTYGHIVGDFVLKELAKLLLQEVKEQGLCARWGGEEFLVFVPYQTQQQVVELAERIRKNVEDYNFLFQDKTIKLTISCGVSFYPQEGKDITTLIEEADKKLYKAKQSGRNKVVV